MKTTTSIPMTNNNIFGFALKDLFDAVKNKLSRKEWTVLLGVSDAAISQWVSGKTFPEPEKIETILSVCRKHELNMLEQSRLDHFLSILEMPIDELWSKVPSKIKGLKASDYLLDNFEPDIRNSISHLFYDLKYELYQQFSREILAHKEYLTETFVHKLMDDQGGLKVRIRNNRLLAEALREEANRNLLSRYADKIKSFHNFYNELLVTVLHDNDFSAEEMNIDLEIVIEEYKTRRLKKTREHSKEESFHLNTCIKNPLHTFENDSLNHCTGFNQLDIKSSNNESFDLFFKDPHIPNKNLMHVEISKVPEHSMPILSKEQSVYCTFNFTETIYNTEVFTSKTLKKTSESDSSPDYALSFNFEFKDEHCQNWYKLVSKNIAHVLKPNKKSPNNQLNPYLINPDLTDSNYFVELLNIEKNRKVHIVSKSDNGLVFLILGNVEVSPTNHADDYNESKQFLSSLFDYNKDDCGNIRPRTCITAELDDQKDYEIQSRGCDSIALLVHYKDGHSLNLGKNCPGKTNPI
jgi:transcriptional regulator with XRE-family HTH domain